MQLKMSKLRGITEIGDWVLVRIVNSNLKLMVYAMEWSLENSRESNYLLEILCQVIHAPDENGVPILNARRGVCALHASPPF